MIRQNVDRAVPHLRFPGELLGAAICVAASAAFALALLLLGFYAFLLPFYAGLFAFAVVKPKACALLVLAVGIAVEPGATDISKPISYALYQMPPGFQRALPITMTPFEVLICVIGTAIALRPSVRTTGTRLPIVVFLLPPVVAFSFAYGSLTGGDIHIGYEEARGLLYGSVAFFIARRMANEGGGAAALKAALAGTAGLAAIVLIRYVFVTGASSLAVESAYAHEDAVFLAGGVVLGATLLLQYHTARARTLLLAYEAANLAALFATSRRSGTLALLVGVLTLAACMIRSRPKLVIGIGTPLLLLSVAYLATYWNKEYGALAQPARAVRSQIDPNARDDSSDQYRLTEKFDVTTTIRLNRVFGVGLGRPFIMFQPLPSLTSFWPLQQFTPHANVLWLWLKFGLLGAAVFIGAWVLALRNAIAALRYSRAGTPPALALVTVCMLLMYFAYAQIDLALIGARSAAMLAAIMAVGLSLTPTKSEPQ